ncbi:response regulator transcription factor [Corynebacterium testudinoris]|uniref:response regulator n=1 Tax=Corynebacterium testudinoris TaxID=136857 RepID=UPI001C8B878F|nr:response regulator transcription factor [Corynebacterium testudinoris]MBX8996960.1 response regulator transcription factor [Corynebacterium testudinoris]
MSATIKALLIDDHLMLLRGLSLLFETIEGIDIVATTTDGSQAMHLARTHGVDIIITDAAMPGTDGLAVVTACAPHLPTLVLTTFDDAALVDQLIAAGAAGYLLKDVSPDDLADAIRAAVDGGLVLDPRIARHAWASKSTNREGELAVLTRTERVVAKLVSTGLNNQEIAAELHLAEGTVKNHVSALLRKLQARDRTMLALRLSKAFGQ